MLFKTDIHSKNVWKLDQDNCTLTMFNHWDGWVQKSVDYLTKEQMTTLLDDIKNKNVYKLVTVEQCNAMLPVHKPMEW